MLIWLAARYLFFFNFCTTWHFPFLQKHENNKKQKQTLNSCFRCISLPHRNIIYKTCNSSAIIQLCDNIILHTMNLILSVSVCIFFIIFFYLRTENVLNNVLMIANNKEHNFYFIYFLLLQYNNTIWENVSSSVGSVLKYFIVVCFSWNVCQQKITRQSQQYRINAVCVL